MEDERTTIQDYGWTERDFKNDPFRAVYVNEDVDVTVLVSEKGSGSETEFPVIAEQRLESGDLSTSVTSHSRTHQSKEDAMESVLEFIEDIESGNNKLHVLDHDIWREWVQFYTISDSELPESMTADELIDAISGDEDEIVTDVSSVDESKLAQAEELTVTIDVYPRHTSEVEGYDE